LQLRELLESGEPIADALLAVGGRHVLFANAWRIFSSNFPAGGPEAVNAAPWRQLWRVPAFHPFGEDVFGNVLVLMPGLPNAHLVDHECGDVHDLQLDPVTLIEVCATDGIGWLDPYASGALEVAEAEVGTLLPDHHLHWVTPLILGGKPERGNVIALPRGQHMRGHAELWKQIRDLPPGARAVPSPGTST
jgi:hypothetical protein